MADPCGWDADMACCPTWDAVDPALQVEIKAMAERMVWAASGMRFGPCPRTLRPCGPPNKGSLWWDINRNTLGSGWMVPFRAGGAWLNAVCGCRGRCDCSGTPGIRLPPVVHSVVEVRLDGVILEPEVDYVLVSGELRRIGGAWPLCQNMTLPADMEGTFEVIYEQGEAVPSGGNLAAGVLACELAKACAGQKCQLPARVTEIVREGITMTLLDPLEFLDDGLTGLPFVDRWITSVNPRHLHSPSGVFSPDLQQFRHRTPGGSS